MVSPWAKRGVVDSTNVNHVLDDASFTTEPARAPYKAPSAQSDLMTRNPATSAGAPATLKMDFSDYDRADPDELNRVLWDALKPGQPMPAPVRSARVRQPLPASQRPIQYWRHTNGGHSNWKNLAPQSLHR